jgi:hypothetical protein
MALYRYLTFDGALETLKSGALKLTPPSEFNDPFDMNPAWNATLTKDELHKGWKATGYDRRMDFEEFLKLVQPNSREMQNAASRSFNQHTNKMWGAVCFSYISDSSPMWAYYGENHMGVVLAYDEHDPQFRIQFEKYLAEVEYTENRPVVKSLGGGDTEVYYTKARGWAHEKEVRIIHPLQGKSVSIAKIANKQAWLLSFPKSAMKEIILGCRVSAANETLLSDSLGGWGYTSAKVIKLAPDDMTFSFRSIPRTHPQTPSG